MRENWPCEDWFSLFVSLLREQQVAEARLRSEGITVASDVRGKKEDSILLDDESQPMGLAFYRLRGANLKKNLRKLGNYDIYL